MNSMNESRARVEARLKELIALRACDSPRVGETASLLQDSMAYSLLAGGKRLRPVMLLETGRMLGVPDGEMLDMACAVEMIHTYSLIHDDLPGMDDDTLRRGRPTSHVVYGEGNAILAGDALLNSAFECMLANAMRHPEHAERHIAAMNEIATGAGVYGMIGGQSMDLKCEKDGGAERELRYIHYAKTACMFIFPMRAAARLAGADAPVLDAITRYGHAFGELFQVWDDVLDVLGDAQKLGKSTGKDDASGKLTAVSAYGLEGAQRRAQALAEEAKRAMADIPADGSFFVNLVDDMRSREN
ncbi:MAG: polyprenyl synthetase family protein [Clostridia bacterium]|nr:polyprenyl synthetase family protein [Clostridia bacterium]